MPSVSREIPASEVVLRSGRTSFELVRRLEPARHGELMLVRRRYDEDFAGYSVIKRPSPLSSEEARRRLLYEARIIAQLSHPNVLNSWHLKGPGDVPHLIMEHVEGYRLEALLAASARTGHALSESFACYVVAEIADALQHAHTLVDEYDRELMVVHRDVTPYNILLGSHGEVKLLDFGAAWSRLAGRVGSEGPSLQGSLAYASPEHAQHQVLDGRSDLFSLGIILLQLLTSRHLFEGAERFDASQRKPPPPQDAASRAVAEELADRIRHYSEDDLEAATRSVPEALRPIVERALAPERDDRFPTCAALSDVLRQHLRDSGRYFSRHEVLVEMATMHYVIRRMEAGDNLEEATRERHLPEYTPRSALRASASQHRAARTRSAPRRR
jgi:serine/threonine protein kinase